MLDGHRQTPGTESTFTENVSARGARVVSVRNWEKGEKLTLVSRTGKFRSSARVAYCQPLHGEGYAVGVEFLETKGRWVVWLFESQTCLAQRLSGRRETFGTEVR